MSKKMKGVAFDSSPYGVYGNSKTMFKNQTLMQDYQELHKDVEASRYKLGNLKQRKETLFAEVRFLQQRHKFLLKSKSAKVPQDQVKEHLQPHYAKIKKFQISKKKEATLRVYKPNQKGRVHMGKEVLIQNTVPSFDPNYKGKKHTGKNAARANSTTASNLYPSRKLYKGKEVAHQNSMAIINLNQERIYNGISVAMRNTAPNFDLNQKETACYGKQSSFQSQAPSFDLNQISREEEEFQNNCELLRFEEPKKGLINEDQLMLSVCRNIGNGSNHAGKRKISWQDPVALRVVDEVALLCGSGKKCPHPCTD